MDKETQWFVDHGHWLIRKVPNTKDQFFVVCGTPPSHVLKIYGIETHAKGWRKRQIEQAMVD